MRHDIDTNILNSPLKVRGEDTTYNLVPTYSSNRKFRRTGRRKDPKTGEALLSLTVVRDPEGVKLPHVPSPTLLKGYRSKYHPHVGKKQQDKLNKP